MASGRLHKIAILAATLATAACGGRGQPPAAAEPSFAVSEAEAAYGGCADPIRVSPAPPETASEALALVRAFVERLRGPSGEKVRARRLGTGACEGVTDPALAMLDFWLVGGRTLVFAPHAPGEPEPPVGLTLLSV